MAHARRDLVRRDGAHERSPVPVADTAQVRSSAYVPAPTIGESPTRPGRLLVMPPGRRRGGQMPAGVEGDRPGGAVLALAGGTLRPAPRGRELAGSTSSTPCSRANASAPSPTSSTCGDRSSTARASRTGLRTRRTPATAPAARVRPSMIAASSSCRPSAVNTAPRPQLKSGSSSNSADGGLDRVEGAAAGVEHRGAGVEYQSQGIAVGSLAIRCVRPGHHPGAAVNREHPVRRRAHAPAPASSSARVCRAIISSSSVGITQAADAAAARADPRPAARVGLGVELHPEPGGAAAHGVAHRRRVLADPGREDERIQARQRRGQRAQLAPDPVAEQRHGLPGARVGDASSTRMSLDTPETPSRPDSW